MRQIWVAIGTAVLLLIGCSSQLRETHERTVQTWPELKPVWVDDHIREEEGFLWVVGHSRPEDEEEDAKEDAIVNAMAAVVKYVGMSVEAYARSMEAESIVQGESYHTADHKTQTQIRAKAFVRRAVPEEWYVQRKEERSKKGRIKQFYLAAVHMKVPMEEIARLQEEKDIRISLDVGLYYEGKDGRMKDLSERTVLRSGDAYAIYIRPTDTCFLYVFQVDDLGRSYRLFPNREYGTNDNPVIAGTDCWIPSTDHFFVLDETTGKERIYVLASFEVIPELEGKVTLERTDLERTLKTMGVAKLKEKINPASTKPPQRVTIAEVKKKVQAEGAFVYETWFWHR